MLHRNSPEVVRAQIEFATTEISGFFLPTQLAAEAGSLALLDSPPQEFTRTHQEDEDSEPEDFALSRDAYLGILREQLRHPYNREGIKLAAEAQHRYESFRPAIAQLYQDIADGSADQLGSGMDSEVYRHSVGGTDYSVSLPSREEVVIGGGIFDVEALHGSAENYRSRKTAAKAIAMACGAGIKPTAKLVAYSSTESVCVSEFIAGKPIDQLNPDDISKITPEQVGRFVHTVAQMKERNLHVDCGDYNDSNMGNILWDAQNGFGIIDHVRRRATEDSLTDVFHTVVKALVSRPDSLDLYRQWPDPEREQLAQPVLRELVKQAWHHLEVYPATTLEGIEEANRNRWRHSSFHS